eukprot:355279-Chlamydomonas_euryale.AAC.2
MQRDGFARAGQQHCQQRVAAGMGVRQQAPGLPGTGMHLDTCLQTCCCRVTCRVGCPALGHRPTNMLL